MVNWIEDILLRGKAKHWPDGFKAWYDEKLLEAKRGELKDLFFREYPMTPDIGEDEGSGKLS